MARDGGGGASSWIRDHHDSTWSFGMDLVVGIHRLLGRRCARGVIWCISLAVWLCSPRLRRISGSYLARIRVFAAARGCTLPRISTRLHIHRFCCALLDRILAWRGILGVGDLVSRDGSLEALVAKGSASDRGFMIISSHAGDMEFLRGVNRFFQNRPVNILIETGNNARFMAYMSRVNRDATRRFVPVNDISPATASRLLEAVDRGEYVAALGDRLLREDTRSVEVSFLGGRARLPAGPWILASLLGADVVLVHCVEIAGRPQLFLRDAGPVRLSRRGREAELRQAVQAYARDLEEILLEAPLDWFNFYDFWKE